MASWCVHGRSMDILVDIYRSGTGSGMWLCQQLGGGDHLQVKKVGECVQVHVYWLEGHEGWCGPRYLWRAKQECVCTCEQVFEWPGTQGPYT